MSLLEETIKKQTNTDALLKIEQRISVAQFNDLL